MVRSDVHKLRATPRLLIRDGLKQEQRKYVVKELRFFMTGSVVRDLDIYSSLSRSVFICTNS